MNTITTAEYEAAFKALYRPLGMYALRMTDDMDEAEDIVQQAFADTWEKICCGTAIVNLKAYLYMAVRNRCISPQCRDTERMDNNAEVAAMTDDSEAEEMARAERDARLWSAIDSLPPERRKILLMAKRDGRRYQEIAAELGISVKTVENQMGKALKSLREIAHKIYTFIFG